MFYHIFYSLHNIFPAFNVFKYITFRTIYAIITALLISFLFGDKVIKKLRELNIGQYIREEGPERHRSKQGTPTMGGILIIVATVIPALLWVKLTNPYLWIMVFTILSYGYIGFLDDFKKIAKKHNLGLTARQKFLLECAIALIISVTLYLMPSIDTVLRFPFFKNLQIDLGLFYIPFAMFVIVGTSNAVNLTDGLDGLAIGPAIITVGTYLIFAYIAGNYKISHYLLVPYVPGVGEITIFLGAMFGAGLGFLWFNSYPAQVFMGDVGSLSIGATIGVSALITKNEILLIIVGGIFVLETLSVIIQVASYKLTKKRVFKMAPIHHHFELKGWDEPKIIVRFWIISILLALIGISTLKLR